jgi:NAD-dependent SIR2 family protein deacetylase
MLAVKAAADLISKANFLVISAGAGMGVDSGLPDFRGINGFWRAYPPFKNKGLSFVDCSNPRWFRSDPAFAWGFFGHRLHLYRSTKPHIGFDILQKWAAAKQGYFVFTSNVDGHFQKAGFDESRIYECHGSINYMQCLDNHVCKGDIWSADDVQVDVDPDTFRATGELPKCKHCSGLARPNILMFGDYEWIPDRAALQEDNYAAIMQGPKKDLVVIEIGAGDAVRTVRNFSENFVHRGSGNVIRINPDAREMDGVLGVPLRALEALELIDRELSKGRVS